jgi:hypothetical protein
MDLAGLAPAPERRVARKASQSLDSYLDELTRGVEKLTQQFRKKTSNLNSKPKFATHKFNALVAIRDLIIKAHRNLSDAEICGKLDFCLCQRDSRSLGMPASWEDTYHVRTYVEAYENEDLKPLVQKMISVAKNRSFYLP